MSTPAVAGLSSQMVVSVVDTAMVGRLENTTVVLAAMGLGILAAWAITSVFSSLATGTHVMTARRAGEDDPSGAGAVLNNSLVLSFVLGSIFGFIGYLSSFAILDFFASDPRVAVAGAAYLEWRFVGLLFFLFVVSYRGFFNGIGHTKIFMYSAIAVNCSNIILNYLLIFGTFGFPKMGIAGAGCASALSNVVGCLFFVTATFLPAYRTRYRYYQRFRFSWDVIRTVVRVSMPVSFQNILLLLGFLVFVAITGIVGTKEQAASQVVITALFMSFLPCFGFGIGAQTLVGQSLGKGEFQLAKRFGMEAARQATILTILLGVVFVFFPEWIILLITTDPEVTEAAIPILRIAGVTQIFYGAGIVLAHTLQAAGATFYVMMIEVVTHWIVFLPVSYLFAMTWGGGLLGAWLALPLYIVSYTLLIYLKYRKDSWLHIKV
ncbi:MAG: MATE family efflux transporter [Ignavibacteria bacterium]|nr:MATE family efflux transporter [Ignavibacteria bacterium]